MKKSRILLGSILMAAALVACGEKKEDAKTADMPAKKTITLTAYKFDDNFISLFRKEFQAIADKNVDAYDVQMIDSQNTASVQNDQIDALLDKGTNVFAINLVDPAGADVVIEKLKNAKVPVVFYNRLPSQEALNSYDKAYYVGIDPNAQGIAQAKLIEKLLKEHPEYDLNKDGVIQYVMLKGEPGHPDAEARTVYSIKTLNDDGYKTEELHLDSAMWDTAMAKDKMDAWLSGPNADKIEFVISNNDGMALGAIESLKGFNKTLPIIGVDAIPEALQKIKAGEMAGTVLNDAKGQAEATFTIATNLANEKDVTEGLNSEMKDKIVLIDSIGIDTTNVDEYLK